MALSAIADIAQREQAIRQDRLRETDLAGAAFSPWKTV
jgi:hypothetical protein